jgi:signal recognition particle receptor subunit beta
MFKSKNLIFFFLINRDIGGQDKLRGIWKFYIKNCEGLFYVVDSSDRERIELARSELYSLLDFEDMKKIPVIIIANKQDIETSLSLIEIEKFMKLAEIQNPYHVYGTCATTGEGLLKAFSHMTELVKQNRGLP